MGLMVSDSVQVQKEIRVKRGDGPSPRKISSSSLSPIGAEPSTSSAVVDPQPSSSITTTTGFKPQRRHDTFVRFFITVRSLNGTIYTSTSSPIQLQRHGFVSARDRSTNFGFRISFAQTSFTLCQQDQWRKHRKQRKSDLPVRDAPTTDLMEESETTQVLNKLQRFF
ncbi:unnamed protein product [Vicia faba]|uniref:Uncharacterized protein n=1 Tax=Vicia faba TaxID=3906 RepID=A0AAV0ZPG4_VICFA|nr:unnamed protein product [Vicia faba]